jgi:hypothetical protein
MDGEFMKVNENIVRIIENRGYKIIALDYPEPKDFYFDYKNNEIYVAESHFNSIKLIVEKVWECPEWLKGKWLVNSTGGWYIYKRNPSIQDPNSTAILIDCILTYVNLEFTPPPSSPWECK